MDLFTFPINSFTPARKSCPHSGHEIRFYHKNYVCLCKLINNKIIAP